MAIEIPRALVEFIMLGPEDDRRQLQDSPILGDVWIEFAKAPAEKIELLITPYRDRAAGTVAHALAENADLEDAHIAYLQGVVAARLSLEELLRFVMPMTHWWQSKNIAAAMSDYMAAPDVMAADIQALFDAANLWLKGRSANAMQDVETRKRYIALAGLLLWARSERAGSIPEDASSKQQMQAIVGRNIARRIAAELESVFQNRGKSMPVGLVWTVSLNRRASPALTRSVGAVKADAARTLFTVDCSDLVWAVLDSGIDAAHHAFAGKNGVGCRVLRSFDFTRIRDIISLDSLHDPRKRKKRVEALLDRELLNAPTAKQVEDYLVDLAASARRGRGIHWEFVERLVEIEPRQKPPPTHHGTHVAGILGASRQAAREAGEREARAGSDRGANATTLQLAAADGHITEAGTAALESSDTERAATASSRALLRAPRGRAPTRRMKSRVEASAQALEAVPDKKPEEDNRARGGRLGRRHVPGYPPVRFSRPCAHAQGNRVRDHRGAPVHPLHQRAQQLHHRSRREPESVDPA